MDKKIPVWVFLMTCLLGLLGTVGFGWAVKHTVEGGERLGSIGTAAVQVANFPTLAKNVVQQSADLASGQILDDTFGAPRPPIDLSGYKPFRSSSADLPGLIYKTSEKAAPGWRVLYGSFAREGGIENALVVISPDYDIVNFVPVSEIPIEDRTPRPDYKKFAHGFEIFPDGSFIFAFDGGMSLQKFDACGQRVWANAGSYHHAVTAVEDRSAVWTFLSDFALVSREDGSILRSFTTEQIIDANPELDILELRMLHDNDLGKNTRNTKGDWLADRLHYNDADPLPASLADRYEGFEAGDLLVSARSLNLVFVVDPDDLRIKWWRVGAVQRQHDPDWTTDGRISIYNNRMSRDYSEIVYIDPETYALEVSLDGRAHNFYSRIRGKHQWLEGGNLALSSPQQGRLFEVDASGEVAFEIFNLNPDTDNRNLTVSEIKWFPPDYFTQENWTCAQ